MLGVMEIWSLGSLMVRVWILVGRLLRMCYISQSYRYTPYLFTRGKVDVGDHCKYHPKYWPHSSIGPATRRQHFKIYYRGFHVLRQAASMLTLKQLRFFTVDGSEGGGVGSYIVLEKTSTDRVDAILATTPFDISQRAI